MKKSEYRNVLIRNMKKDLYSRGGDTYKAYFVHNGKKIDKSQFIDSKKSADDGTFFSNYKNNMNVIMPQKVFNLNYRSDNTNFTRYIVNLIEIDEEYRIVEYDNCTVVECLSLLKEDIRKIDYLDGVINNVLKDYEELKDEIK